MGRVRGFDAALAAVCQRRVSSYCGRGTNRTPILAAHHLAWVLIESVVATGPKGGGPAVIVIMVEESEEATDIKVVQAKPKPRNLGYAPTIAIAGEAPVAPNLKAFARTPAQAAR